MVKERETDIPVTESSGNVFARHGFAGGRGGADQGADRESNSAGDQAPAFDPGCTAKVMGVDQPKVSALLNGRLANFSSERLMRLLIALGRDVDITIRAKPRNRADGRIRVLGGVHV